MTHRTLFSLLAMVLPVISSCTSANPSADLVLRNGKVVTMDPTHPKAQAIAMTGDAIVAVGSDAEIQRYIGKSTKVIDLQGHLAIPGFIESHGHFMAMGQALTELDLMHAHTWQEIVDTVAAAAKRAKPGQWILGHGWHQEKWDRPPRKVVAGFQTNDLLNQVAPDNPVLLTHASGHALIANEAAMKAAGVSAATPSLPGGEIIKDSRGRPTGIFVDDAQELIRSALTRYQAERTPAQVHEDFVHQVRLAVHEALSKGVTSFQDQGESLATIDTLKKMVDAGDIPLRLYVLISQGEATSENEAALAAHHMIDYGDGHLTVRAIGEVLSDGALGSESAWMLEPYSDNPHTTGLNVTPMPRIKQIAEIAAHLGFQISVHAIGDRANREVLDTYQAVFEEMHLKSDTLRWRIEHAQHLNPTDIPRFAQMGIIASMQGIHACSDAPYVVERLGERRAREGAYVWQTLWKSGAVVTNGTDVPVEDISPIASFHCSVTRYMVGTDSAFFPAERLTREQALKSYTLNGAYAMFHEKELGSLVPGKWGDVTVLDRDIMTVPPDSILGTQVLYTIVGGKVVYQREQEAKAS